MAFILSIDTSLELAAIALADNGTVLGEMNNALQTDHASWIHGAIRELLSSAGRSMSDLSAIAVTSGPGSYTGLRVGMATAKGLCYALNIPLLTASTLLLTAMRAKATTSLIGYGSPVLICPMIDARRMEVFTALYDDQLTERMPPSAVILDESAFQHELQDHIVLFCGNGAAKWKAVCHHPNAIFPAVLHHIADLAAVAEEKFNKSEFSDLAYTEPDYIKNVYTGKAGK